MRALTSEDRTSLAFEADEAERDIAMQSVVNAVHRLNGLISDAVKAGITVELMRVSRRHDGTGNWGDQIVPLISQASRPKSF